MKGFASCLSELEDLAEQLSAMSVQPVSKEDVRRETACVVEMMKQQHPRRKEVINKAIGAVKGMMRMDTQKEEVVQVMMGIVEELKGRINLIRDEFIQTSPR